MCGFREPITILPTIAIRMTAGCPGDDDDSTMTRRTKKTGTRSKTQTGVDCNTGMFHNIYYYDIML